MALRKLYLPLALPLVVLLYLPSVAHAGCLSGITIKVYAGETSTALDSTKKNEYFNMARCQCRTPMRLQLVGSGTAANSCSTGATIKIMTGVNCYNESTKEFAAACHTVYGGEQGAILSNLVRDIDISGITADKFMGLVGCGERDQQTASVFIFESDGSGNWSKVQTFDFAIDTMSPLPPIKKSVAAGEEFVTVYFSSNIAAAAESNDAGTSGLTEDKSIKGYQVLCEELNASGASKGGGLSSPPSPAYSASENLCPNTPVYKDAGVGDASSEAGGADAASAWGGWGPQPLALEAGTPDSGKLDGGVSDQAVTDQAVTDQAVTDQAVTDQAVTDQKVQDGEAGTTTLDMGVADAATPDAGTVDISYILQKKYVCSKLVSSAGKIQVDNLTLNTSYKFYVVSIDSVGNPSAPVLIGTGTPTPEEDLWERYKRSGGKAEGGYCFVATASYGSYDHPHVRVLRQFRDKVLLGSSLGRRFVAGYYKHGPEPAAWISQRPWARTATRLALWPVTVAAGAHLYTTAWQKGLGLVLLGALVLGWSRRRRRKKATITDRQGGAR